MFDKVLDWRISEHFQCNWNHSSRQLLAMDVIIGSRRCPIRQYYPEAVGMDTEEGGNIAAPPGDCSIALSGDRHTAVVDTVAPVEIQEVGTPDNVGDEGKCAGVDRMASSWMSCAVLGAAEAELEMEMVRETQELRVAPQARLGSSPGFPSFSWT